MIIITGRNSLWQLGRNVNGNQFINLYRRASWQFQPGLDTHEDANPPITIQGDAEYREQPDLEWHWWAQEEDDRHDVQYADQIIDEPPPPPPDDSEIRFSMVDVVDEDDGAQDASVQIIEDSMEGILGLTNDFAEDVRADEWAEWLTDQVIDDAQQADDPETRQITEWVGDAYEAEQWVDEAVQQLIEDVAAAPDDSETRLFFAEEAEAIEEAEWVQAFVDQIITDIETNVQTQERPAGGYETGDGYPIHPRHLRRKARREIKRAAKQLARGDRPEISTVPITEEPEAIPPGEEDRTTEAAEGDLRERDALLEKINSGTILNALAEAEADALAKKAAEDEEEESIVMMLFSMI